MLFQIYGENAGFQLLGWLLVFAGLVVLNELSRRTKQGGVFFFDSARGPHRVFRVHLCGRGHGRRVGAE